MQEEMDASYKLYGVDKMIVKNGANVWDENQLISVDLEVQIRDYELEGERVLCLKTTNLKNKEYYRLHFNEDQFIQFREMLNSIEIGKRK